MTVLRTPAFAANRLGMSVKTLYAHVHAGHLRYVDVGTGRRKALVRFTDADLDAFLNPTTTPSGGAYSFTALKALMAQRRARP